MPLVMDLALLALFCAPLFLGWQRGFFQSVLSLGRLTLSFLVAVALAPTLSPWLNRTFVYPSVYGSVSRKFTSLAHEVSATARDGAEALAGRIPAVLRPYLRPESLDPTADVYALAQSWSETVAGGFSRVISTVIAYLAVFVLAFILLSVVIVAVGALIKRVPLVRTVDRILGLSLGVLIGGLGTLLVSALLATILSVTGHGTVPEQSFMLRLSEGLRELILH